MTSTVPHHPCSCLFPLLPLPWTWPAGTQGAPHAGNGVGSLSTHSSSTAGPCERTGKLSGLQPPGCVPPGGLRTQGGRVGRQEWTQEQRPRRVSSGQGQGLRSTCSPGWAVTLKVAGALQRGLRANSDSSSQGSQPLQRSGRLRVHQNPPHLEWGACSSPPRPIHLCTSVVGRGGRRARRGPGPTDSAASFLPSPAFHPRSPPDGALPPALLPPSWWLPAAQY